MPTISVITFDVQLQRNGNSLSVVVHDLSVYPNGAKGIYTITEPDGYVRQGDFTTPDIVSSYDGTTDFYLIFDNLRLSSTNEIQCGTYTFNLQIKTTDNVITSFTRTAVVSFKRPTHSLREEFDVFTPDLKYYDDTNYQASNFDVTYTQRNWYATSSAFGGEITSSDTFVDLINSGDYYDATYSVSLDTNLEYQHQVYAWLSVTDVVSTSITTFARTPLTIEQIVLAISDLRTYQESLQNSCKPYENAKADFEYAQTLFGHIIDKLKNNDMASIYVDLKELLYVLEQNHIPAYTPLNIPIDPYDLGTLSGGSVWGTITGNILLQTDLVNYITTRLSVYDSDLDGTMDEAEKMTTWGRNATGSTLYKGTIVYISGSTGNRPNFVKAQANAESTSAGTFGVVIADILNNSDGKVATIGTLHNLDTRSTATNPFTNVTLSDGDTLYLHPTVAGYVTNVKPSAPNHIVYVGKVVRTHPTLGTIVYRIQNGYEISEIHDVSITSPTNGQGIFYNSTSGLWENKSVPSVDLTSATENAVLTVQSGVVKPVNTVLSTPSNIAIYQSGSLYPKISLFTTSSVNSFIYITTATVPYASYMNEYDLVIESNRQIVNLYTDSAVWINKTDGVRGMILSGGVLYAQGSFSNISGDNYLNYTTGATYIGHTSVLSGGHKLYVNGSSRFEGTIYPRNGIIIYGDTATPIHLIIKQSWSTAVSKGVSIGSLNQDISSATAAPVLIGGRNANAATTIAGVMIGDQNNQNSITNSYGITIGSGNTIPNAGLSSNTIIVIGNSNTFVGYTNNQTAAICIGSGNTVNSNTYRAGILIGSNIKLYAHNQLVFGHNSGNVDFGIREVYFGYGVRNENNSVDSNNGNGIDVIFTVSGAYNGANLNGGALVLAGGKATGTGTPGKVVIATASTTTSGSTLQTLSNRVEVTGTGQLKFNNYTSSTSFTGTLAGLIGFDSSGNLITTTTSGGGGSTTLAGLTDVTLSSPTNGQSLTYNSSTGKWVNSTVSGGGGSGTVTSVDMTVPTGLSIAGTPITTSGTLAITYASGYAIPTTIKQTNWDDAYTWVSAFPTQTSNGGKVLTTNGSVLSWGDFQPLDSDLTAIAILSGTTGLLRKTAANTWSLDTSTYLTSYTETDPVFSASAAFSITNTDRTNWTSAYSWVNINGANAVTAYGWGNHASAGYAVLASANSFTGINSFTNTTDATSTTTGAVKVSGGVGIVKNLYVGGNIVSYGNLQIDGNFTVGGTTTTVNAQTLSVADNMIYLNNGSTATITNVVGTGTTVTYTAANNYQVGMTVTITGVTPTAYNLTGVIINPTNSTQFTVSSTATGVYVSGGTALAKTNVNPDLGFAGGYNDGTYAHTGLFRDADDGVFKFFKGYTPEPDASVFINIAHASFAFADVQAATFIGNLAWSNVTGVPTASSTTTGVLSSTNWNTFNNKQSAITLTTTGSSGAATFVTNTLNIPTYTLAGLGGISLTSLSATTPIVYNNTTGVFSMILASTSTSGYLSSTDWNTFNNKQAALTGTSSQLAAGNGSAVTVGSGLTLSAGTLTASGGSSSTIVLNRVTIVAGAASSDYTLVLGDAGEIVEMNVDSAAFATNTVTVPLSTGTGGVAFPIGTQITVTQYGTSITVINPATAGVLIRSATGTYTINARYSAVTLVKMATDEWYLYGGLTQGNAIQTIYAQQNRSAYVNTAGWAFPATAVAIGTTITTGAIDTLILPVSAGKFYSFKFVLHYSASTTGTGAKFGIVGVTASSAANAITTSAIAMAGANAPTRLAYDSRYNSSATAATSNYGMALFGLPTGTTQLPATSASTVNNICIIEGVISPLVSGYIYPIGLKGGTGANYGVLLDSYVQYQILN